MLKGNNTNSNSLVKNKNFLSSGNLFLDKIIGGFNLGSIVLLVEDSPTEIYQNFLKYFIAEGVVNEQKIFFYYSDEKIQNEILKNLPYKSTQVEAILNAKKVNESKSSKSTEMKIAWRYENIQYSNVLEDLTKSSSYIFDLSRQLQDTYLIDKNKNLIHEAKIEGEGDMILTLDNFTKNFVRDYQNFASGLAEDEVKYARIIFPNLFTNFSSDDDKENLIKNLKLRLLALRNIARSVNGVIYLTVNKEFMDKNIFNLLIYFSDYVFSLKSFLLDAQKLQDYDALFYINKLPRICSFKTVEMETDTYGILTEKRKMVIEKIDIGVEIDRNTKVKESDITASQAMCGQEKYSKNYEF
jgi:hypothetical protein